MEKIKLRIREYLGAEIPLGPCAKFGLFFGKLFSKPKATDFVLTTSEVLLARRSVIQHLNELGYRLRAFEIKLDIPKKLSEDYMEIWAPPLGSSGVGSGNRYCQYCERGQGTNKFIIAKPNSELESDLFVLGDAASPIIFSEKLVRDIKTNGFTGLDFAPIPHE